MNILIKLFLISHLFGYSFSFLTKVTLYYRFDTPIEVNGESYSESYQTNSYYYIYDKQQGESFTIKFGKHCLSDNFRFYGYVNFNGSIYSTSVEDLWVTPNSQNVEYTGTSVSTSSIKQNSEIIRLKQQTEDSCQITLTIPITLDTNAVKVLPIDCYNTTQYIRYENDSLYFSSVLSLNSKFI